MKHAYCGALTACCLVLIGGITNAAAQRLDPCAAVVAHKPAPDVTYRPGVDVRGRRVVAADVNAPSIELPEELTFEISVPMPSRNGRHFERDEYFGEALVGFLTLHADGSLSFNGRSLDEAGAASLRSACAAALRRR